MPSDAPDEGVAAHYGDPLREQRRLAEGQGFVDLSNRAVLTVTGPDRLSWLHSLISQHVADLRPGQGTTGLVLSPNGHVEHVLAMVDDGTTTWIHAEPGTGPALAGFLDSMRFMLRVEVADVTDDWAIVWQPVAELHPAMVSRVTSRGRDLFVPRAQLTETAKNLGAAAGVAAYEALRVAAGEPRLGIETDHRTIPHEVGLLASAVHLDKGCYRGQETVARVHNLGRPPRRMVLLHLDGSRERLPAPGADVVRDGRSIGRLGTAVHHFELGPIALAVVKRATPDGETVQVVDAEGEPMAAAIEALPGLSYEELELAPTRRPQLGAPRAGLGVGTG
ncbi:MAG: tRNA-modifying protein YgfZ [Frankiales bacterium]|nr:tRNA-modifying protein YgfZ [Frankiales bacterium]MDX6244206.1 tRNA-modifying protein YgfZ [Frankiales bacterium]